MLNLPLSNTPHIYISSNTSRVHHLVSIVPEQTKALFERQVYLFRRIIGDIIKSGLVLVGLQVILFRYFLPALGMHENLIAEVFVGDIFGLGFLFAFKQGVVMHNDIYKHHLLAYYASLPARSSALIGAYLIAMGLPVLTLLLTSGIFGGLFLAPYFTPQISWIGGLFFLGLGTLFLSMLVLTILFLTSEGFFLRGIWPRILSPLFITGGIFFSWHRINAANPDIARFFLLNPALYMTEGAKYFFCANKQNFISPLIAIAVLLSISAIFYFMIDRFYEQKFDFVRRTERKGRKS